MTEANAHDDLVIADRLNGLVDRASHGDLRSVAQLVSLTERDTARSHELWAILAGRATGAQVVGLTGPPGVGKSTTTSGLITALRQEGKRVAVLAIDPSSPKSGGALLGDRIRMQDHSQDDGVFIRSMASRGHLGGLSIAVPNALRVLDASGFDIILIETVGVGQAEFDVATFADTTILLLAPGLGDGVQAAKAGILELADIFVVNKSDRDGAEQVTQDLRHMQAMGVPSHAGWNPPILKVVASQLQGLDKLVEAIADHLAWLKTADERESRRLRRAKVEIEAMAFERIHVRFEALYDSRKLDVLVLSVVRGRTDPHLAAITMLKSICR